MIKKIHNKTLAYLLFIIITFITVLILILKTPILHISPHIKTIIWLVFIVCGVLLAISYFQDWKPEKLKKGIKTHNAPINNGFQEAKVLSFENNRIGDVDKMTVRTADGQEFWLHFPPHTAKQVMSLAKINKEIQFEANDQPKHQAKEKPGRHLISLKNNKTQEVLQISQIPAPNPSAGKEILLDGQIAQFKMDGNGTISGFVLKNYLVDIPPHLTNSMVPLLKSAKNISLKGYVRPANDGFVNTSGLEFVKPYTLRIDKTDYIL